MAQKNRKNTVIVLDKSLVKSKAWLTMQGAAWPVYLIFRCKCQWGEVGKAGHERKVILNNGKITFTYREAQRDYGITRRRFTLAIDTLIKHGFVDITRIGNPLTREATWYSLDLERYKHFGTEEFESRTRAKGLKIGQCDPSKKKSAQVWNSIESEHG